MKNDAETVGEKISPLQRLYNRIKWAGFSLLLLGNFFDAIQNSTSLITVPVATVVTIIVIIFWVFAQLYLRKRRITWVVKGGQKTKLKRLGEQITFQALGAILLLWIPSSIDLLKGFNSENRDKGNKIEITLPTPVPTSKKVTILLADFKGVGAQDQSVPQIVFEQLEEVIKKFSDMAIYRLGEIILTTEEARAKCKERSAQIIIWGSYVLNRQNVRVTFHFDVVDTIDGINLSTGKTTLTGSEDDFLNFTIQDDLSDKMAYLVLVAIGTARYESNDADSAINLLSDALNYKSLPGYIVSPPEVIFLRGSAYLLKSKFDEAIKDFNQALIQKPNFVKAINNRGVAYLHNKKYELALQEFNRATRLDPQYAPSYSNRALLHVELLRYDDAIQDADKALRIDPNYHIVRSILGMAYAGKGDYDRAIDNYNSLLERDPKSTSAYINRGLAFYHKKLIDKAEADYTQAIDIEPDPIAFNNRGNVYYVKKLWDKAISDYSKAVELDNNYAEAYINRGAVYLDVKKDFTKALADFNEAIRSDPNWPLAYCNRGGVYARLAKFDSALADYDKAIELDKNFLLAYLNKALAYKLMGDKKKAINAYQQMVEASERLVEKQNINPAEKESLRQMAQQAREHLDTLNKGMTKPSATVR